MIVKPITDLEQIKQVLCHPEIYEVITDDNSPSVDEIVPPLDGKTEYIGGFVDGAIIGVVIHHTHNDRLDIHLQVLPEHRKQSREFFTEVMEILKQKDEPIFAEVPVCYPNVLAFGREFGFKEIDTLKDDYPKHGKLFDTKVIQWASSVNG
ncbi:MAG: hypothetical protein V3W52_17340 [Syntrophobacteria bacterium]